MKIHSRTLLATTLLGPSLALSQEPLLSPVPTQAVYEYQLNYELPWQRWYGGPGLSLGGTMPTQGVFGYSSLNGLPLPAPLGAGVYVNAPAPNVAGFSMPFPGPFPAGPFSPSLTGMAPPGQVLPPGMPSPGPLQDRSVTPAAARQRADRTPRPPAQQVSSPAARRASLIHLRDGDSKLRDHQWVPAYVQYRSAADLAPERPEAHFRLGLTFTALKQYSSAVREFKRSLDLDPTLPQSGETLTMILGTEPQFLNEEILPTVTEWAFEDLRDADRLFVLGLLLYFNDDPRGSELLEAAQRTTGGNKYISTFLTPDSPPRPPRPRTDTLPSLQGSASPQGTLPSKPAPAPSDFVLPERGAPLNDDDWLVPTPIPQTDPIPLPTPAPPLPDSVP